MLVLKGSRCSGPFAVLLNKSYDGSGNFSFTYVLPSDPTATAYSFQYFGETTIGCTWVTVVGAAAYVPPPPPNIFLCYSADQTQPGVWPQDVAEQLLQQGYWLPYAVSGDASGGTNLGGYHLSCNIASTQSVSDSFVGGDGTVLGPAYAGDTVGLYPQVGG